jgi:GcrA cell cycle regulator
MQSNWTRQHSEALREFLAGGLSYARIADAINARFNTFYSRNATIGRARRMGLDGPERPADAHAWPVKARPARLHKPSERGVPLWLRPMPVFERTEPVSLRCVEIDPRHLSLLDLEPGDCRYPYGGDEEGEAITFCGHPRHHGTSYCAAHFHLTRGPGALPQQATGAVSLRLVEAA